MDILLSIHSLLRWVIIGVAALAILKFAVGWLLDRPFKGMDRGLASGFSGLMDLQVLLGLIYFLWDGFTGGGFPGYRWLHLVIMVAAAAIGHVPARLKMLGDKQRFFYSLVAVIGALVLVFASVVVVQGK